MCYSEKKLNKILFDFLTFEAENKMFNIEFNHVKIWGFIRKKVFNAVSYNLLNLSTKQCLVSKGENKFKPNILWKHCRRYLLTKGKKHVDILFLNHPRRVYDEKNYVCLYTDLLSEKLSRDYKCLTVEEPYWHEFKYSGISHFAQIPTKNIYYTDLNELKFLFKKSFFKYLHPFLYKQANKIVLKICSLVEKYFHIKPNIQNILLDSILYIIINKKTYEKLLDKISPKIIMEFYCPALCRNLITYIANERNIPVIDLQHGVVGGYEDILYKFKQKGTYTPLPNYIYTFSDKLFNAMWNPFKNEKKHIIPVGFPYLEKSVILKEQASKKYILILSQWIISEDIKDFVLKLSDLFADYPDYHIICKLHPYERTDAYYTCHKKNLTVVSNNEHNLYYYLKKAYVQVGVYSTALYEGVAFKLPTFIISNMYGAKDVISILGKAEGIYYITTPEEVFKRILSSSLKQPMKKTLDFLWKCDSIERIRNQVKYLIK